MSLLDEKCRELAIISDYYRLIAAKSSSSILGELVTKAIARDVEERLVEISQLSDEEAS